MPWSPADRTSETTAAKIKSVAELGTLSEHFRNQGRAVVLAHGTFDLLHLGHVKHLEAARGEGDILIVTLTADRHVNKGPGRPVFNEHMRAEMLASLACVNYVGISYEPSSETALSVIRPNIYVKGQEYTNPNDDVTGKIVAEREMVERHGGRVVFTQEMTFSSSTLINRHMNVFEPNLRAFLDRQREAGAMGTISDLLGKVANMKVLMVGDTIIDEYQYVSPLGKAAKENMIATKFEDRELFAGGVIAAANHVASFCGHVDVLTSLGEEESHEDLVRDSLHGSIGLWATHRPKAPTTRKCRFVESGYVRKLFEVYTMDDSPLDGEAEQILCEEIEQRCKDVDVVIVTDFGHGLVTPKVIEALVKHAPFLAVNTQTNSANTGFNLITKYPRADYVCIDAPEARLAVADKHADVSIICGKLLPAKINCDNIIVTAGRNGCVAHNTQEGTTRIPVLTQTVLDTIGAGDAFFVVTAPLVAAGLSMEEVGFVGNIAGALKVGIIGHRQSVDRVSVLKTLTTLLK